MAEVQARTGLKTHQGQDLTTEECLLLAQKLTSRELPTYCSQLLHNANKTGILSRRASRVGKAWDLSDGHGKRTMVSSHSNLLSLWSIYSGDIPEFLSSKRCGVSAMFLAVMKDIFADSHCFFLRFISIMKTTFREEQ